MLTLCVTGPDGAGKNTQIDRIAAELAAQGLTPAVASIWDLLTEPSLDGGWLFSSRDEAAAYVRLLSPVSRMFFYAHGLQEGWAKARATEPDVLLLNAWWYKYYATEVAHGGDAAKLRQTAAALAAPDLTIYLRIDPALAAERKGTFNAYETGFDDSRSVGAFSAFQRRAMGALDALAAELRWTEVAAGRKPAAITADIMATLPDRLR